MSEENVEVVRQVYAAAARRDTAAILSLYHPEVEWDGSRSRWSEVMVGEAKWQGHDALRTFFRDYYEAWGNLEDEIEELIDAGDHVISVVNTRGRGPREWSRGRMARQLGRLDYRERKGRSGRLASDSSRRPQSRRAVGVGDV